MNRRGVCYDADRVMWGARSSRPKKHAVSCRSSGTARSAAAQPASPRGRHLTMSWTATGPG
jgi:hypothetical protein